MAATFISTASAIAPGSSVTKGVFQITAGSTVPVRICSLDITMDGGASSFWPTFTFILGAGSFTASTGGTTLTPAGQNGDGQNQTATAVPKKGTFTAELATGSGTLTNLATWYLPNTSGLFYQWPLGRELYVPKSNVLYLQAITPASFANNIAITIVWEE